MNMPGMSGLELVAEVRGRFPDVALLMATGVEDRDTITRALELGVFGYLLKPIRPNELVIHVAHAVERRRLRIEARDYRIRLEETVLARTAEVRRREEDLVGCLVAAAEWRDTDTAAHVRRIGAYSAVLAGRMGWPPAAVEDIRLAAMMHDVGKIGVPDSILLKPGKLSPDEFTVMQTHAVIGARMLSTADAPLARLAAEIAHEHHEKWDGSGYPRRLSGGAISLAARIVAVADVYDALVHARVYKPAMPEEKAVGIIRADAGTHFDPDVVTHFLAAVPEFRRIREAFQETSGARNEN
jgi:putative two-component system response regulator